MALFSPSCGGASGRVALAGRGSRQPHSQGGGCSASPLLSEGRQPLSPALKPPFQKALHNVLYPTLSPVRTAPSGPGTAGGSIFGIAAGFAFLGPLAIIVGPVVGIAADVAVCGLLAVLLDLRDILIEVRDALRANNNN